MLRTRHSEYTLKYWLIILDQHPQLSLGRGLHRAMHDSNSRVHQRVFSFLWVNKCYEKRGVSNKCALKWVSMHRIWQESNPGQIWPTLAVIIYSKLHKNPWYSWWVIAATWKWYDTDFFFLTWHGGGKCSKPLGSPKTSPEVGLSPCSKFWWAFSTGYIMLIVKWSNISWTYCLRSLTTICFIDGSIENTF